MLLGIVTAVVFLLTAAKFITKRLPYKKLDTFFLKIHRISGIVLLILSVIHAVTAWSLIRQRPIGMVIAGIALASCVMIAFISHVFAKTLGKKWLTVHRAASAAVCICLMIHIIFGITSLSAYQSAVASITYDDIQVNQVADGKYEGEYDAGYIYAKVSVTIAANKIKSIEILEHRNERGAPAEKITERIIKGQSLDVDMVSGATNSSLVIKKAIENALKQGIS